MIECITSSEKLLMATPLFANLWRQHTRSGSLIFHGYSVFKGQGWFHVSSKLILKIKTASKTEIAFQIRNCFIHHLPETISFFHSCLFVTSTFFVSDNYYIISVNPCRVPVFLRFFRISSASLPLQSRPGEWDERHYRASLLYCQDFFKWNLKIIMGIFGLSRNSKNTNIPNEKFLCIKLYSIAPIWGLLYNRHCVQMTLLKGELKWIKSWKELLQYLQLYCYVLLWLRVALLVPVLLAYVTQRIVKIYKWYIETESRITVLIAEIRDSIFVFLRVLLEQVNRFLI